MVPVEVNYYPHHIGDYLRDTAHLSATEDGIYRRMLDLYYASEKPLPLDQDWLCRLLRAKADLERESVDIVLKEFFEKKEDGWHNKRADEEIRKGRARIKAAKVNGKSGGRPRTQKEPSGIPVGSQKKALQKPKAKSQKEIVARATRSPKTPIPNDFTISPRVRQWATARGTPNLEKHLEHFIGKCKAKDYRYVDWDEGFMGAVRDDWAKLGEQSQPIKVDL